MPRHFLLRRLLWAGPLTCGLALASALLFYSATRAGGYTYPIALPGASNTLVPMPMTPVFIAVPVVTLGAVLVFAFLLKVTHVPLPPFLSISAAALLVSFGGPFSLPGDTPLSTKLLLCAMFAITGAVIVAGLLLLTSVREPGDEINEASSG